MTALIEQPTKLKHIKASEMQVSHEAQRDFSVARADKIISSFRPEEFGIITVNKRDGVYYIIDGQHRCYSAQQIFGQDVSLPCWVYEGLTEQEEAEKFLLLNDVLTVHAMDKFQVGVTAGRRVEVAVSKIAAKHDLVIGHKSSEGGTVAAVSKVTKIYERDGEAVLDKTFGTLLEAFGDSGLTAPLLSGAALFHARYPDVDYERLAERLGKIRGGANGLLGRGRQMRMATRKSTAECVAAVIVEQYNKGLRGRSALPTWWRE